MSVGSAGANADAAFHPVEVTFSDGVRVRVHEQADAEATLRRALGPASADPYARALWPSSIAAAEEVARLLRPGDRVLDVCAGTGLVALSAARRGARAMALDHDAAALEAIRAAAAAQQLRVEVERFDLLSDAPLPPADLVVFSDVLYEERMTRAVTARALEALHRGSALIVADPGRVGRVEFDRCVEEAGWALDYESRLVRHPAEPDQTHVDVAVVGR